MANKGDIHITYRFIRKAADDIVFPVTIHAETLLSTPLSDPPYPEWTKMDFYPCAACTCKETHCPVAVRLVEPLRIFSEIISHEPATIEVETLQRRYVKDTDMQQGIGSLFGLLMATSGCPSLRVFRAMARYHLPFASFEETFFRVCGTYLMGELFRQEGMPSRESVVAGLSEVYERVSLVNSHIMQRLRKGHSSIADSSPNAVALLAAFSTLVPLTAEEQLQQIEKLFHN